MQRSCREGIPASRRHSSRLSVLEPLRSRIIALYVNKPWGDPVTLQYLD
jgi:hypothetical protein